MVCSMYESGSKEVKCVSVSKFPPFHDSPLHLNFKARGYKVENWMKLGIAWSIYTKNVTVGMRRI